MQTRFPHAYVLNVMADDHPGIVAAVTAAIDRLRGNMDACSQTVLEGYFTLIMVVSLPEAVEAEALAAAVRGGAAGGLQVAVRRFEPDLAARPRPDAERFVLTAFGRDKPGIVRRFTQYLAGKDINIIDLYGEARDGDFVLIGQVEVPAALDLAMLQTDLEHIAAEEGFTVRLQHENVFVATNQLRLTAAPAPP
jgi:predicted amino acid-binding ACT domain protein